MAISNVVDQINVIGNLLIVFGIVGVRALFLMKSKRELDANLQKAKFTTTPLWKSISSSVTAVRYCITIGLSYMPVLCIYIIRFVDIGIQT